jgi:hypothetical protein
MNAKCVPMKTDDFQTETERKKTLQLEKTLDSSIVADFSLDIKQVEKK